jgi:hypothetical protein
MNKRNHSAGHKPTSTERTMRRIWLVLALLLMTAPAACAGGYYGDGCDCKCRAR